MISRGDTYLPLASKDFDIIGAIEQIIKNAERWYM